MRDHLSNGSDLRSRPKACPGMTRSLRNNVLHQVRQIRHAVDPLVGPPCRRKNRRKKERWSVRSENIEQPATTALPSINARWAKLFRALTITRSPIARWSPPWSIRSLQRHQRDAQRTWRRLNSKAVASEEVDVRLRMVASTRWTTVCFATQLRMLRASPRLWPRRADVRLLPTVPK